MKRAKWRRCPHARIRGIYGDEIVFATPGQRRLQCIDCGRYLDGPVSLATHISIKWGTQMIEMSKLTGPPMRATAETLGAASDQTGEAGL